MSQIQSFFISAYGDPGQCEDVNHFLRSHVIIRMSQGFVSSEQNAGFQLLVEYTDAAVPGSEKNGRRIDYRALLATEEEQQLFDKLRKFRADLAKEKKLPGAYMICKDEHLYAIVTIPEITAEKIAGLPHGGNILLEIFDPKKRTISAVCFDERIIHHAVMNVLEPVFERQFIFHSYACRKGKGTHEARLYAQRMSQKYPCFLKLDVHHFFDSIDHEVLKQQLLRIIKNSECLLLLFTIIDSYSVAADDKKNRGLPIGNLTSQFFANLYLSPLDHFALENLHAAAYCRYMDDVIVWGNSQEELCKTFSSLNRYLTECLHLSFKEPVYGKVYNGVPFLGFLIKPYSARLLQENKRRRLHHLKTVSSEWERGLISDETAAARSCSIYAACIC